MRARSAVLVALLVVALPALLPLAVGPTTRAAAAQTAAERELAQARAALRELRQELEVAEAQRSSREEGLAEAEAQLQRLESVVNEVAMQVEQQRVLVRDAEADLLRAEDDLAHLEEQVVDRIARLFKMGPELTFDTLLSASGADEVIARSELLERVVLADQLDLELLDAHRINVEVRRELFQAEAQRLEAQLEAQQELRDEAEELRASRALAVADVRQRTERLGAQQDHLEAEEETLVALIERQREAERQRAAELERAAAREQQQAAARAAATSTPAPRAASGGFAWPMCAPVTSEYGPRWGTIHRGIDLGARTGTPIRSVGAGTVIYAGWQRGYGNITLIDHGSVVSAYAHQSGFAVGVGARVSQGQVIGYVGMTGNTTGPHLHLEMRVGGSAVNPRQYLSGSPC